MGKCGKNISSKIGNEARLSPQTSLMQYSTLSLKGISQEKDTNVIKLGKEGVKLCLFANNTVLYLKDPAYPIRKLLDLINGLQDTKSMQKSQ